MKKKIRQTIERKKRKLHKQLEKAVRFNFSGPVFKGGNYRYEIGERIEGTNCGGIGAIHHFVKNSGLTQAINSQLQLLKIHSPYYESDHVLNIAYNLLCGGKVLEDIELLRNNPAYLKSLDTKSIPDPTTAGDFCRRFSAENNWSLMAAVNEVRCEIWKQHPTLTRETARIDVDGTILGTTGDCKEGINMSYKGIWGYHPLLVSLSNTQESLFIMNRSGNKHSSEGAKPVMDKTIALCRQAGFSDILLRGDTDFYMTGGFDRWDEDGVRFVFGVSGVKIMRTTADAQPDSMYEELVRKTESVIKTQHRQRPDNIKKKLVKKNGYKNMRLNSEQTMEFEYTPGRCKKSYRIIVLRKNITVEKGELALFDKIKYFFFVTNDREMTPAEVVREAADRCNQENLIEQLKHGVHAIHAPVNTLNANWAYMIMASLAWSIKAWIALSLSISPRWKAQHLREQQQLLKMDFRTFINRFVRVAAQVITGGRRITFRIIDFNADFHLLFRMLHSIGVST